MRNVTSANGISYPDDIQVVLNTPDDGTPQFITLILMKGKSTSVVSLPFATFMEIGELSERVQDLAAMASETM